MKIFLILFLLLESLSCSWPGATSTSIIAWTNIKVPEGSPVFQQGFKDGCSTAYYSRGNVLYRSRYQYRYDAKLIGNPEYRFGHSRGYTWCFTNAASAIAGPNASWDRYLSPYGYDATFNAGNVNNAWGGFFGNGPLQWQSNNAGSGLDGIFDVLQKGGSGTTGSAFGSNPLWAGGSKGQFFGQPD